MSLGASAKNGIMGALQAVQADRFAAGYRNKRLFIACYHGVISERAPGGPGDLYYDAVIRQEFEQQLIRLAKWYRFVDLAGAAEWLDSGSDNERPPALITFDDGYRNNVSVAAPILRKLGIPAVFFLTTNYVGSRRILWPTEIGARIEQSAGASVPVPGDHAGAMVPTDNVARNQLGQRIRSLCKALPNRERLEYLDRLRNITQLDAGKADAEVNAFMSWDEARQLAAMGFDIGSHTMEHPILARLDSHDLKSELRGSKAKIEAELGRPVHALAYPNGGAGDFDKTVMDEAARAGYGYAFAVGDRLHSRADSRMAIKRMIIPGQSPDSLFHFMVTGCRDICRGGQ
jgi:peptidoglycan/xylan/chitin deacetylase (PgdA/CDA1 family)